MYVAGQVPQNASGSIVGIDDPYAQALQCLANLEVLMSCYDFSVTDIQRLTVYVTGPRENLAAAWKAVLEEFSNDASPATLIGVSVLGHENQLVEIDATIEKVEENFRIDSKQA